MKVVQQAMMMALDDEHLGEVQQEDQELLDRQPMHDEPPVEISTVAVDRKHFVQAPPSCALCSVCQGVPEVPLSACQDQCLFCQTCMNTIKKEAYHGQMCRAPRCQQLFEKESLAINITATKFIATLKVRCLFKEKGCSWIGGLPKLTSHTSLCEKNTVSCPNALCSARLQANELGPHVVSCVWELSVCPHEGCSTQVAWKDQGKHRVEDCNHQKCGNFIPYANGQDTVACPVIGFFSMVEAHRKTCDALCRLVQKQKATIALTSIALADKARLELEKHELDQENSRLKTQNKDLQEDLRLHRNALVETVESLVEKLEEESATSRERENALCAEIEEREARLLEYEAGEGSEDDLYLDTTQAHGKRRHSSVDDEDSPSPKRTRSSTVSPSSIEHKSPKLDPGTSRQAPQVSFPRFSFMEFEFPFVGPKGERREPGVPHEPKAGYVEDEWVLDRFD